jgi:transposase
MEQHLLGEPQGNTTRLEVLEGPTGRRAWPDDVKGRIVAESFEPGARVADVARRHGMAAQHLSVARQCIA